ncbi:hypothetical protein HS041_12015 [Planomonospora sp. ID67723]|uniref:hypothetical protein n=1 Tax=Planomonospora sp. ID67723 TaxID=2738134 RepID=UPI0018C39578|nr:hypothetical protein [Planomonospora sp. ID67723]MBG0828493.1 hypothetical protein [Planomonospora sp. ID67723]
MASAKKNAKPSWMSLPSEQWHTDPAFRAHIAESRAACGLPPRITDPIVLARLAKIILLGQVDDAPAPTGASGEERAA